MVDGRVYWVYRKDPIWTVNWVVSEGPWVTFVRSSGRTRPGLSPVGPTVSTKGNRGTGTMHIGQVSLEPQGESPWTRRKTYVVGLSLW